MNKIIVLCIIICGISACSKDNSSIGKCVFRYNQPNSITSLDPAFARNQSNIWAIDHIYNTLVQLDDSLHLQPCLAKSWTIDDEGRKYQFILNTKIYFQDDPCFEGGKGRSINASDVVYSLNRIIDEKVASPGSWIFSDRIDSIQPFVAINDSAVEIRLKTPFMPFLQLMSMQYCSIVPHEAVEKYGKLFREHPVGTGPFQLKKWVEGQTMILDKNPNYFEKLDGQQLPFVDIVRISFIGDKKTAFLQLLEGNLDFMSGFDPSMANELLTRNGELRERYADKILCYKSPYLNTEYLGVNLEFNDPKSPLL
ncbi:MAG: ABC transporter substrate-binding protein, partial [Saprospiraceae bacterium]|nr:ABC transporter substrate-binding protein [Saprospiraceae bacterium]